MNKKVLFACDPEIFVMRGGKISSIAGVLGYNKMQKMDTGQGVRLQEDNVLLEFDIDPCDSFTKFDGLVSNALSICKDVAGHFGLDLALGVSSHNYSAAEVKAFPESAKEFGCSSDVNALTGRINPVPSPKRGLRTAGGHIHIGFLENFNLGSHRQKVDAQQDVSIMCDYYLGLPSLFEDKDTLRRSLYGMAGAVRNKEYGIEYRTLSNYWIENYRKEIWDRSNLAVDAVKSGKYKELINMINPANVQRAINTGDKAMAEQYMRIMEGV